MFCKEKAYPGYSLLKAKDGIEVSNQLMQGQTKKKFDRNRLVNWLWSDFVTEPVKVNFEIAERFKTEMAFHSDNQLRFTITGLKNNIPLGTYCYVYNNGQWEKSELKAMISDLRVAFSNPDELSNVKESIKHRGALQTLRMVINQLNPKIGIKVSLKSVLDTLEPGPISQLENRALAALAELSGNDLGIETPAESAIEQIKKKHPVEEVQVLFDDLGADKALALLVNGNNQGLKLASKPEVSIDQLFKELQIPDPKEHLKVPFKLLPYCFEKLGWPLNSESITNLQNIAGTSFDSNYITTSKTLSVLKNIFPGLKTGVYSDIGGLPNSKSTKYLMDLTSSDDQKTKIKFEFDGKAVNIWHVDHNQKKVTPLMSFFYDPTTQLWSVKTPIGLDLKLDFNNEPEKLKTILQSIYSQEDYLQWSKQIREINPSLANPGDDINRAKIFTQHLTQLTGLSIDDYLQLFGINNLVTHYKNGIDLLERIVSLPGIDTKKFIDFYRGVLGNLSTIDSFKTKVILDWLFEDKGQSATQSSQNLTNTATSTPFKVTFSQNRIVVINNLTNKEEFAVEFIDGQWVPQGTEAPATPDSPINPEAFRQEILSQFNEAFYDSMINQSLEQGIFEISRKVSKSKEDLFKIAAVEDPQQYISNTLELINNYPGLGNSQMGTEMRTFVRANSFLNTLKNIQFFKWLYPNKEPSRTISLKDNQEHPLMEFVFTRDFVGLKIYNFGQLAKKLRFDPRTKLITELS